jgi:hypothetical protein
MNIVGAGGIKLQFVDIGAFERLRRRPKCGALGWRRKLHKFNE